MSRKVRIAILRTRPSPSICDALRHDSGYLGAAVGDIVVAIVDNEFTLKRLDREKGRFVLRPANKAYAVIRPGEGLEIFGVVTGLFRKYGAGEGRGSRSTIPLCK